MSNSTILEITKTSEISAEMVADLIDTAGYGIGYWATKAVVDETKQTYTVYWNKSDFNIGDLGATGKKILTFLDVAKAVEQVAGNNGKVGKYIVELANHFIDTGDTDSDLGDVVIQIACLGEIIYG